MTRHQAPEPAADPLHFLVGCYTSGEGGGEGIYRARLDPRAGAVEGEGVAAAVRDPSFLALAPGAGFLYAVNELPDGPGEVSAFAMEGTALRELGRRGSRGSAPCHLAVDRSGRFVLVANYGSGTVAVLPIRPDGALDEAVAVVQHRGSGADPERQEGPHAHSVTLDPANRHAVVADLGTDRLMVYRFDAERGSLAPAEEPEVMLPPGAGPRHFAFHPGGRLAFVVNELDNTVAALGYDPERGSFQSLHGASTLPAGFHGHNQAADLHLSGDGRFLYASNRGHDSIAVWEVGADAGDLRRVQHEPSGGAWPRQFALSPDEQWLLVANERSDAVAVLRRDPGTGRLASTGQALRLPRPVCVRFIPGP